MRSNAFCSVITAMSSQAAGGNHISDPVVLSASLEHHRLDGEHGPSATGHLCAQPVPHICGPVVPQTQFWNTIPVIANIANLPLLISAFKDRSLLTGSHRVPGESNNKNQGTPKYPHPGVSPGTRSGSCLKGKSSKKATKIPI
mmetsp:Transcript_116781/g.232777  ORF Transcript_116781/g.232777 Transcript_116781/m.232777 type:complete len:143 (+) Transcript_116781:75-503(+)